MGNIFSHLSPTRLVNLIKSSKSDFRAAVAVALILIPQSMAYAQMAGLPAYVGLYASIVPVTIASIFGSSKYLSTGPAAITSILTLTSLSKLAQEGSSEYLIYSAIFAFLVGLCLIFLSLTKMGSFVQYISHPVIIGFINAAAIIILVSQLPKLAGISISSSQNPLHIIYTIFANITDLQLITFGLGISGLIFLIISKRYLPNIPSIFILIIIGIITTSSLNYPSQVVGSIPTNFLNLNFSQITFSSIKQLLIPAFITSIVSFISTFSIAKQIALKTKTTLDVNRELLGQGIANLSAGILQSLPVSGSLSRTAINVDQGAKSRLSSIYAALIVLATLLLFSPFLSQIPQTILSAIIISSVLSLINFRQIKEIYTKFRIDGITAIITIFATLALAPRLEYGIFVGIFCSFALLGYQFSKPKIITITLDNYQNLKKNHIKCQHYHSNHQVLGVIIDHSLIFSNSTHIENKILSEVHSRPHIKYILLFGRNINYIDQTGLSVIKELKQKLAKHHVTLLVSGFNHYNKNTHLKDLRKVITPKYSFSYVNQALHYVHAHY